MNMLLDFKPDRVTVVEQNGVVMLSFYFGDNINGIDVNENDKTGALIKQFAIQIAPKYAAYMKGKK